MHGPSSGTSLACAARFGVSGVVLLLLAGFVAPAGSAPQPSSGPSREAMLAPIERAIDQAPSSGVIRAAVHALIDGYGALLKQQVDRLLDQWERLSPEERQQVRETIKRLLRAAWPPLPGERPMSVPGEGR